MRVTLLGNYPHDEQESMTRYAGMLRNLLAEKGWQVEVLRPEPFFGRLRRSGHGLGKWLGYLDKFIVFPLILRAHLRRRKEEEAFLVHVCDHSNAMYTRWLSDVPHLVTCHDVLAIQSGLGLIPENKTKWTGRVLQNWILSGLKRAALVICISDETRKNLLALAPELASRSVVIENAIPYPYFPMPRDLALRHLARLAMDAAFQPEEDRFLFHVGGNQWYKNREGVIRIFSRLCATYPEATGSRPLKLVMAGKPPTEAMRRLVEEEKLAGRVIFTGLVTDDQLGALYSRAEALVFPSLREGFGWPILEAQACGCPVVTSDRPPMNQGAGPAALLANPEDASDFAARLHELLSEGPELRHRRKAEGLSYVTRYDPPIFLKQILLAYESVLKK